MKTGKRFGGKEVMGEKTFKRDVAVMEFFLVEWVEERTGRVRKWG